MQNIFGQNAFHRAFEDVFGCDAFDLQLGRNGGRELDKLVIEQWFASLDRMSHAHPIDLRQNVIRQVRLDVEVLK